MNIKLMHRSRLSGENLSNSQTILFHFLSSQNNSAFSLRLKKHFGENIKGKEDSLMKSITEIENFLNGLMFLKGTKRKVGALIKPLNYTLKPFLENKTQGAETLICEVSDIDKDFLATYKQALWGVLIKLY